LDRREAKLKEKMGLTAGKWGSSGVHHETASRGHADRGSEEDKGGVKGNPEKSRKVKHMRARGDGVS